MPGYEFGLGLVLGAGTLWLLGRRSRWFNRFAGNPAETHEVEEERDRLFNLSIDLLAIGDLNGRLRQVNPAWVRTLRWSRDDIMARRFPELVHPDDLAAAECALGELQAGSPVEDLELRTRCRDGSYRWIAWSSFPLTARGTVFTVARDITERKLAEAQLQRYQRQLQRLANQLASVEERQQRRLAEILHDTLAQELFAAQTKLSLLQYPDRVVDQQAVLREVAGILDHASELTRSLTFELFPPALYEVGLDAALEWLCRSFRRTRGLDCHFTCLGETRELTQDLRALLYQGARELLGNVYRHAGAETAAVTLTWEAESICLQVDDDGCGFVTRDPPPATRGSDGSEMVGLLPENPGLDPELHGFGLFNLRERLGQIGGELSTGSSLLGGGRVTITVPLAASED